MQKFPVEEQKQNSEVSGDGAIFLQGSDDTATNSNNVENIVEEIAGCLSTNSDNVGTNENSPALESLVAGLRTTNGIEFFVRAGLKSTYVRRRILKTQIPLKLLLRRWHSWIQLSSKPKKTFNAVFTVIVRFDPLQSYKSIINHMAELHFL